MRREFGYSRKVDLIYYVMAAALTLLGVLFAAIGQWLGGAVLIAVAFGAAYLIVWLRRKNAPFLIVDDEGVRAPPARIDIAWSNLERAYLLYPAEGEAGPALAFEVRDPDLCGPGAHAPALVAALAPGDRHPDIYVELPMLDAPAEEIVREIERRAPFGRDARRAHATRR